MKGVLKRNGLSITLLSLFLLTWLGQFYAGFHTHNEERIEQGTPALSAGEYLESAHFWESTFENWESEFLQMAIFVVLTAFLYQQGSSESNPLPEEKKPPKKFPRRFFATHPMMRMLYENSLSIALFSLFLISFTGHLLSGWKEENLKRAMSAAHASPLSLVDFFLDSSFWFQSLQNWQSEFLSIGVIVLLSIFLRQKNSSQSKAVDAPHFQTED